ncbi:MAG: nucleoside monophosphate kinase [Patescibacteria group bacterium]|nr:nucleoside monophosphate kinase [Patescibacteria group bacterium]MCL5224014.1 nucleoside monophosphate kinase [Patescibacteria group bacterium]
MRAVIIFGSPGAGKGMQATLLEHAYGFIHFDTGKYIEREVHGPRVSQSHTLRHERKLFDSGFLNTPSWAFGIVKREVIRMSEAREDLVFSGSPRTLFETEHLVPLLERLYGRKNISFFHLSVPKETAVKRNLARRICSVCGAVIIDPRTSFKRCPICRGRLTKRTLDNKQALVRRFEQYVDRTKPIFEYLKGRGYKIIKIDGTPSPEIVFAKISKHI